MRRHSRTWWDIAEPAAVPRLRGRVVQWAAEAGVPEPPLQNLRISVSEALTNTVVHAYRSSDEPGPVGVTVEVDFERVSVTVRDEGQGMQPRLDSPGAGIGLQLVSATADAVEVREREPRGTELCMSFSWAAGG